MYELKRRVICADPNCRSKRVVMINKKSQAICKCLDCGKIFIRYLNQYEIIPPYMSKEDEEDIKNGELIVDESLFQDEDDNYLLETDFPHCTECYSEEIGYNNGFNKCVCLHCGNIFGDSSTIEHSIKKGINIPKIWSGFVQDLKDNNFESQEQLDFYLSYIRHHIREDEENHYYSRIYGKSPY